MLSAVINVGGKYFPARTIYNLLLFKITFQCHRLGGDHMSVLSAVIRLPADIADNLFTDKVEILY